MSALYDKVSAIFQLALLGSTSGFCSVLFIIALSIDGATRMQFFVMLLAAVVFIVMTACIAWIIGYLIWSWAIESANRKAATDPRKQ